MADLVQISEPGRNYYMLQAPVPCACATCIGRMHPSRNIRRSSAISNKNNEKHASLGRRCAGLVLSVGTLIKHGLVSLVLIGKVDCLVVEQGEVDVAQHLASARPFALDVNRKRIASALLFDDA